MLTAYDQAHLTSAQQVAIQNYTQAWNDANKRGDTNAMEQARLGAMAIRNSAGYTTSIDGSQVTGTWNPVVQESVPDYNDVLSQVKTIVRENNAQAQSNAQAQWDFNREEAQKNRDWQQYMSDTSMQRMVKDYKLAGINPILGLGSGAPVTSGASASGSQASVDNSATSVLGSFLNTLVNSASNIITSQNSALSAENVARINNLMQYKIASEFPGVDKVLGGKLESLIDSSGSMNSAQDIASFAGNVVDSILDLYKENFSKSKWEKIQEDWQAVKDAFKR